MPEPAAYAHLPVADLHCDLPSYLAYYPDRDALCERIGCSVPYLRQGNVRLQVMAFYTPVEPDKPAFGLHQSEIYRDMAQRYAGAIVPYQPGQALVELEQQNQIAMLAAIENATGFCYEHESLEQGFYIGLFVQVGRVHPHQFLLLTQVIAHQGVGAFVIGIAR